MKVRPCLRFQGDAAAAIAFWQEVVPQVRVLAITHREEAGPGLEGGVRVATLSLAGQEVLVTDDAAPDDAGFTPALSFFLTCDSEEEIDRLAHRLAEGGRVLMALGDHGFSRKFAWVEDRYHVSWQLNLP